MKHKNKKEAKNKEEVLKNTRSISAQGSIPFIECYENGLFRTDENNYTLVCEFTSTGYLSKTEAEQVRKNAAYRNVFCELPIDIHYEEIVYNRPVGAATYTDAIASTKDTEDEIATDFFRIQRGFAEGVEREISLKRYLIALSVEVLHGENPYNKLTDAYAAINDRFRAMDSSLRILTPQKVFEELYHFYNPYGGALPDMPVNLYRRGLDIKDMIAPDGIEFLPDSIRLGSDAYVRVMSITSYGSEIVDTLTHTLLNNNLIMYTVKHVEHVGKDNAIKEINSRLDQLEQRRQTKLAKNHTNGTNYVPLDMQQSIEGCNELLEALSSGNEEFLRQTIYVAVCARTPEQLDEITARLKSTALTVHCTLRTASLFTERAFRSILPLGRDYMTLHQFMLASEAAVATPFSFESVFDKNGYYYGANEYSGEPIIINRKLDKSSNGFVFGKTGAGKGIFVKSEIANIIYQPWSQNDDVIVIDASGEYIPIADAFGGRVVDLAPSSDTRINPLRISKAQRELLGKDKAIASKISYMIALLSELKSGGGSGKDRGLNGTEASIIDDTCTSLLSKKEPCLADFYDRLGKDDRDQAHDMQGWLKRYVQGSVTLFAGTDDKDDAGAHDRFTVFCVKNLSGDLRNAGMLALLESIEDKVMENYTAGRWTYVYIEEMHRYFDSKRNPYASARFARMFSELRKFGCVLTGITQLPLPVLASTDGATMLYNSSFVVMTELDRQNIDAVAEIYELNDDQRRTLQAPDVGQYVIRTRGAATSVKYLLPGKNPKDKNKIYDLFNTSFYDKFGGGRRS